VQEKSKASMNARYGKEHALQVQQFRTQFTQTMMTRYGHSAMMQVPELKAQVQATVRSRYNVDNVGQAPEIKAKIEATFMAKYGVRHSMHNRQVYEKQQNSAFSTKTYTLPSGKTLTYQGYEHFAYNELLTNHQIEEDELIRGQQMLKNEIEIWYEYMDKTHRYYPDIYLPDHNKIIEVKSRFTYSDGKTPVEQNDAKMKSTRHAGFECEIWIISSKGEILEIKKF
jgi:hypothetical protein